MLHQWYDVQVVFNALTARLKDVTARLKKPLLGGLALAEVVSATEDALESLAVVVNGVLEFFVAAGLVDDVFDIFFLQMWIICQLLIESL